jgi:DNA-binding MarR family transcriptional regulator
METVLAHLCGRRMTQKLLAAEARGLISGPTLSRALADMEARDLIRCMPAPEDARVKLLLPTERALSILFTRADESYAEFGPVEKRLWS